MKSKLAAQAKEFLRQTYGDNAAIAEHFKVKDNIVKSWMQFGKFPQRVFEELYEAALRNQSQDMTGQGNVIIDGPPTLTTPEIAEDDAANAEWVNEPPPQENGAITLFEIKNMLVDLHTRLANVEQGNITVPGQNIPHSGVRPPSGARSALQAAGIVDPGLPQKRREVGIGTGIAPSRAEAHASTQGPRGNPAGPAKVRKQIQPGDPGWNGRVVDQKGNVVRPGWNDPKPKMQTIQVAQWPVNR